MKNQNQRPNSKLNKWLGAAIAFCAIIAELPCFAQGFKGCENGHEWVDMGTSVMWASSDLEYSEATEGRYYTFSEAQSHAAKWGPGWRVPTKEEFNELFTKCDWVFESSATVKITAKNGNIIRLRCAGYMSGSIRWCQVESNKGFYWTQTKGDRYDGYCLYINHANYAGGVYKGIRELNTYYGCYVRPVIKLY